VPQAEIDRARQEGLVGLLAVAAAALPGRGKYTADELAERVGMPREQSRRLWRALGFPDVDDDDPVFTDADVESLSTVQAMISMGFTNVDTAVQLTRVIGSSLARIAEAILSSREERNVMSVPFEADLFALGAAASLDTQSRLLDYVWRRHLQAASRRRLMSQGRIGTPTAPLAVGFADLVGFTAMSQQISGQELARVVDRFEALAFDQVAGHGGRVAKMIGDEVMFVVDDPEAALETALALAEAYADDEILSDVRVGLSWGDVLTREGDYYGPVVNLASRIVNIALPGAVVISEPVHAAVAGDARYLFHPLRQRTLKDIGRVRLWRVRRGHPSVG
jgi:adenylate cyclase